MKYRKLRIAWSVLWGVVAVLLCALCVRSYWIIDEIEGITAQGPVVLEYFNCESLRGRVTFNANPSLRAIKSATYWRRISYPAERAAAGSYGILGFDQRGIHGGLPHWLLALLFDILGAAPWLPNRFSLRTLLIATTLVAALLGLVAWLR